MNVFFLMFFLSLKQLLANLSRVLAQSRCSAAAVSGITFVFFGERAHVIIDIASW